ncbi:MAG: hypothetical protein RLZZ175_251 [Bacteroidota bacterium]|jgi:hypothetical protein
MYNNINFKKKTSILLFIILFFVFKNGYCQIEQLKQEFIGTLQTSEGQYISYKLIFSKDETGKIIGKSITDFYGKNCTESSIEGKINSDDNTISFQETKNISTKSKADPSSFCYVQINNLKFEKFKGKFYIKGVFKAKFPNGVECAHGMIYMASAELLEDIKSKTKNKDTLHNEISKLKNALKDFKTLTSNDVLDIKALDKVVKLVVWDSYLEDNDQVDIYVNGTLIHDNLTIKQDRKTIEIPVNLGVTEIKIYAENEGSSAKNTLTGFLQNGNQTIPFQTKLKTGQFVFIKINK